MLPPMNHTKDFSQQLKELQSQILLEPDKKYRLILKALKQTNSQRDKQEIKKLLNNYQD